MIMNIRRRGKFAQASVGAGYSGSVSLWDGIMGLIIPPQIER